MSPPPSKQSLSHWRQDVARLQQLAGETLHVSHDDTRREFLITTRPLPAGGGHLVGGLLLCRARRYEVAATWLAGYQTGVIRGGRG